MEYYEYNKEQNNAIYSNMNGIEVSCRIKSSEGKGQIWNNISHCSN